MSDAEEAFQWVEEANVNALINGGQRTIADLERTIIVSTNLIVDTLYKTRH